MFMHQCAACAAWTYSMIPTFRLLLFLLLGALLVAGVALAPALLWLALAYIVAVGALVGADYAVTTRPGAIEVERINDSKLSLGAENAITLLLANRGQRPISFQLRDEYPYQFISDAVTLEGVIAAYDIHEARYHLRPLQRGNYQFGDINIRYLSALKTFVRQARYPAEAQVKVYPNVLDVRKYDLLARRGQPIAAEYETERSQYIVSMIDTGRLMRPPIGDLAKLDYAINTALLLSYVATLKGDHVGLLTFADDVRTYLAPKRGKGQFYHMLEALYNVQFEPVEADYGQALAYLGVKHKRRSLVIMFTDLVTLDAAKPLIAHMARLAQRHLPLCVVISDPNITRMAAQPPRSSDAVYQRAVAEMLMDERRVVLDTLNRSGVLTLDVPADKLTVSVINKYLELKGRGAI